jgi:hypothetical protein
LAYDSSSLSVPHLDICFIHGDVYNPIMVQNENYDDTPKISSLSPCVGVFNHIITNPPFVAVPKTKGSVSLSPALYSAGGGVDGMGLLRKILINCFKILKKSHQSSSSLLMVTELPNVEDSCELLASFLDKSRSQNSRIRVAYIADDVETVYDYANEREIEAGLYVHARDWNTHYGGIRNRALVLVTISGEKGDSNLEIASYKGTPSSTFDTSHEDYLYEADCEDVFLIKEGIKFSRDFLL